MELSHIVLALLIGYAFGNIPNGYLYAKSQGVDIFKEGSGNPGSTNILRTLGKRAGCTVLLMDIAKTILPILILHMLWKPLSEDESTLITLYTGLGAILGHDFTCIPKLHGGKGVACTGALIIAFDWRLAIILLTMFVLIVAVTRYVSLGSVIGMSAFFLSTLILGRTGWLPFSMQIYPEVCMIVFVVAALGIFQHRSNLVRLMQGRENKLSSGGKK